MNKGIITHFFFGLLLTLLVCGVLVVSQAKANEDQSIAYLETLVVTASRSEKPLADTPVRTLLMGSDTIKSLHSRDIRDALRMLPGIQLREIHGKTGDEVQMQGLNGDRVLILVDGLPVSATTGSTIDTSQLSALDIEQIEVIPGASSALYGSAAMGGVINIITKKSPEGTGGRVSLQAGSFAADRELSNKPLPQRHLLASGYHSTEDVTLSASVDRRSSAEFDLNPETYPGHGFDGTKDQFKLSLANRFDPTSDYLQHQWHLNTEYYIEDLYNRRLSASGYQGRKEEDLTRYRVSWSGHFATEKTGWSYAFLHEQQRDETAQLNNDPEVPAGNLWRQTQYNQQKASLQGGRQLGTWADYDLELTSGVELFREGMEQRKDELKLTSEAAGDNSDIRLLPSGYYLISTPEVAPESRASGELFTQLIATKTASEYTLEWSPGARWQFDTDFGGFVSPSFASRQSFPVFNAQWELQLRESLAVGYRVPNLKNRYYIFDHSVNGYMVLGDPDLQPEYSRSLQLSLSLTNNHHWHLELSAFLNRIYDLIEATNTGETQDAGRVAIYRYTNYANALTQGYELAVQTQVISRLKQRVSYSYLDAQDLDTNQPLVNRARHHLKGLWTWQVTSDWEMTLTGEYQGGYVSSVGDSVSDRKISPNYVRWDVKTGYQLTSAIQVFGGVNNLTNSVRDPLQPYDRRPVEGRFPYIGFDARI